MKGIYIHIPFCIKKCNYCDFCSFPNMLSRQGEYIKALNKEASSYKGDAVFADTLYFGGGTPSLLDVKSIESIIKTVNANFTISPDAEITIEANPATITEDKAKELHSLGINRISLGAQSFIDAELATLGRAHCADDIEKSFAILRQAGFSNISLDLMYALPGQTMQIWKEDLEKAVSFQPEHISAYMLIPEPGTPFTKKFGEEPPLSEELQAEMWEFAGDFLDSYGLSRYEISNHALPGGECRHNQNVWHGKTYLGLGPSACSFDGKDRFTNAAPLSEWLSGVSPEIDSVSEEIRRREVFMMGLRTVRGWNKSEFNWNDFLPVLQLLQDDGLIKISEHAVKPTKQGLLCWNTIAENLI